MVNKPKQIGTAAETAIVRAARTRGFSGADRLTLTGATDRGDIGLCPGAIVECKGGQAARTASDGQIAAWLAETERERRNAGADIALLVTQRPGIGAPNAHRWWAHMTVATFLQALGATTAVTAPDPHAPIRMTFDSALALLRASGYGQPLDHEGTMP